MTKEGGKWGDMEAGSEGRRKGQHAPGKGLQ